MPVLTDSCAPPQVLFSTLGIISPPPINIVLRQIRVLTEVESTLDHWTYNNGTVEQVFSEIFYFLQGAFLRKIKNGIIISIPLTLYFIDNFSELSPRVKQALSERPFVPVGNSFVKANRLFFRLQKDLAPFFYEVPRGKLSYYIHSDHCPQSNVLLTNSLSFPAFGAYDILLRQLGVRDSPKSGDYAVSLKELKNEIGGAQLNANELNSVIEVVNIAASDKQQASTQSNNDLFAPDQAGKLVSATILMQNDMPWLINSGRINADLVHLVHPKLSKETCNSLHIEDMSKKVIEVLDHGFHPSAVENSTRYDRVNNMLNEVTFLDTMISLVPRKHVTPDCKALLQNLIVVEVESIRTRFVTVDSEGIFEADLTDESADQGPFCFIDQNRILLGTLPIGISCELAISTTLCDKLNIGREHVGGVSALLASPVSQIPDIRKKMGIYETQNNDELYRGDPGYPLVAADLDSIEIKPLKMFKHNEIVAIRESNDSSQLVYGTVSLIQDSSSMSRLRVLVDNGVEKTLLSSQVYSLKAGSRVEEAQPSRPNSINIAHGQHSVLRSTPSVNNGLIEDTLIQDETQMSNVCRDEVLTAVQDLLKSADLSLNDDVKKMMDSNLSLKEQLETKSDAIKNLERKTKSLSKNAMGGIEGFLCPITQVSA